MDNDGIIVSIFTPTYNRAYILPRLYNSLCNQTDVRFEWLIVDDGSTDSTEELVLEWIKEEKIHIKYYKQSNGGKPRAYNTGVEKCNKELFIVVDSDDYITNDCVEMMLKTWDKVKDKDHLAGVLALKGDLEGKPLRGFQFPRNVKYTTVNELYYKYKFRTDMTMMYRTDVLKKFPYWVADGEKFIGEGFVWSQIDQEYQMYLLPKVLTHIEFQSDGYTNNVRRLTKNNPKSYVVLKQQTIKHAKSYKDKYLQTILCIAGCIMSNEKEPLKIVPNKFLGVLAYIPAWIVWIIFYKDA